MRRVTVFVSGDVQGVGFRWWTGARARELGLGGHARNTSDGRVEVVAQGEDRAVEALLGLLGEHPSSAGRPGRVGGVTAPREETPAPGADRFVER